MQIGKLNVEYRQSSGKNEARRLRASGRVPGICYGAHHDPIPIALDPKVLKAALDPERKRNTLIHMTVQNMGDDHRELTVMLKDYQMNRLRGELQHVDFVAVDINKNVTVDVPLVFTGRPVGTVDGGQFHAVFRQLLVKCKPADIPTKIEVDITPLKIGDVLHIRDIQMPSGVQVAIDSAEALASVMAPKVEKTTAEEAAAAEAAAAATAEAGGPAAAGTTGAATTVPAAAKGEAKSAAGKKQEKK